MRLDLPSTPRQHRTRTRVWAVFLVLALLLAQAAGWWHQALHALPLAQVAQGAHALADGQHGTQAQAHASDSDVVHHDAGSPLCLWLDHLLLAPAALAAVPAWDMPAAPPRVLTSAPRARAGEAPANAYAARAPPHLI